MHLTLACAGGHRVRLFSCDGLNFLLGGPNHVSDQWWGTSTCPMERTRRQQVSRSSDREMVLSFFRKYLAMSSTCRWQKVLRQLSASKSVTVVSCMTASAKGDEIQVRVLPRMTAECLVVDLQVRHSAAGLTPPAIATQNLLPQTLVCCSIQPQTEQLGSKIRHDGVSRRFSTKVCF
jgi:hypothetical protein